MKFYWKASISYGDLIPTADFEFETDDTAAGFESFYQWLAAGPSHDWTTVESIVITRVDKT